MFLFVLGGETDLPKERVEKETPKAKPLCISGASSTFSLAHQARNPFITALLRKLWPDIFPRPLLMTQINPFDSFVPAALYCAKPHPKAKFVSMK